MLDLCMYNRFYEYTNNFKGILCLKTLDKYDYKRLHSQTEPHVYRQYFYFERIKMGRPVLS